MRSELFGIDRLATHARMLAESRNVTVRRSPSNLLERLEINEATLHAFNKSTLELSVERRITPAAEWMRDNFFLIDEQILMARRHLPKGYSQELPHLIDGPCAELPRVYDIMLHLISHSDAQIDESSLSAFIHSYQEIEPLTLGEIWAIPIMLRLGLIENLSRITVQLAYAREGRNYATQWVDRLQYSVENSPSEMVVVVAEMAESGVDLTAPFVAEFCQRLSRHSPILQMAKQWVDQRLSEEGHSVEQLVHQESQDQAADQVSVSHTIGSLRFLNNTDWKTIVEDLSIVESHLRTDPAKVYAKTDFVTRDKCRHAVENIARRSEKDEIGVARAAISLAEQAKQAVGEKDPCAHVGYYLIGPGRDELEAKSGMTYLPFQLRVERMILRCPKTFYFGGIISITLLLLTSFVASAWFWNVGGWQLWLLVGVFALCASQLGVELVNTVGTLLVKPRRLARMDFSKGLPQECRSAVVIPTMLTSEGGIDSLLEAIEVHYLANRDQYLHFCLLTDYRDAATEHEDRDGSLLERAKAGVEALNLKYKSPEMLRFYLMHRPRKWNEGEKCWMGYERKRGKLLEFNALLRGHGHGCFSEIVGDLAVLQGVKYVITLDTDTLLPGESAREMIGALHHPLNRPVIDDEKNIVIEGYGVLQPRVGSSLPGSRKSWLARLFGGEAGIDPYTRQVSDFYQDIFKEGSFIGKGIYDVDAFEKVMNGRFPENRILSHDLLEGCHVRSGLISDVVLYEDHPTRYNIDALRRHRWVRGDWQIARWTLFRVPALDGNVPNPLSVLSRWKIFDNLRRSLVPLALVIFLLGGWWMVPALSGSIVLLVLAIILIPAFLSAIIRLITRSDVPQGIILLEVATALGMRITQSVIALAWLPYEAYYHCDAIVRTLTRLTCTKRGLLEWATSRDTERRPMLSIGGFYGLMWMGPLLAIGVGIALIIQGKSPLAVTFPVLALWFLGPVIAWILSQPLDRKSASFSPEQTRYLRRKARITWHFFETFVTDKEQWLPPDNFQELPVEKIASRTSPTNIGLSILSNLTACDFGYITENTMMQRTGNTLDTMDRMEKFRGHLYNWYDTRSLAPLNPSYVSSVDSGNLAGHLLVMASGLRERGFLPISSSAILLGLQDTLEMIQGTAAETSFYLQALKIIEKPADSLRETVDRLKALLKIIQRWKSHSAAGSADLQHWIKTLELACNSHLQELQYFAPWLNLSNPDVVDRILAHQISLDSMSLNDLALIEIPETLDHLHDPLRDAAQRASERIAELEILASRCESFAGEMDFAFLYNPKRHLFTIGYNAQEGKHDNSYYDLLASESRLGSYVAIAMGQIPQEHWFSLDRLLVLNAGTPLLVSWSGSMFEYLMPNLVMPSYEDTLLDDTCISAVSAQMKYGKSLGIPWGISESGYNRTDAELNYQYRAFGVPGTGIKQGLAEDLVIAPYATALGLMVAPLQACENLQRLEDEGRVGPYGFYEAVDYTATRMPPDETSVTIQSYMAHHQGMIFLSLLNVLLDAPMQRRFSDYPMLKAADLLLQERIPKTNAEVLAPDSIGSEVKFSRPADEIDMRVFTNPTPRSPEVNLLSNGRYHMAITSAGGGYSRWEDLAITRWREDSTRDNWGSFVYVRDLDSGALGSIAYQPVQRETDHYEAIFTQARAEFKQQINGIGMHTTICISPEDDVEIRRITFTNRTDTERKIEITTYAEVSLAPQAADIAHPAFSNLFVQTEFLENDGAILCTRRARSEHEKPAWLLHQIAGEAGKLGPASCETDRSKFVGRGGSLRSPAALYHSDALSNTAGSVLDPAAAVRRVVTIPAHDTAVVDVVYAISRVREAVLDLGAKYRSPKMVDRAFDLAWTHSHVTLHLLNADAADARTFGRLASALIYADSARRADPSILKQNALGQSSLWRYGISGDSPIIVLSLHESELSPIAIKLIKAHSYWRMMGLTVELLILIEDESVYRQSLQDRLISLISSGIEADLLDAAGGIFVRRADQVPHEEQVLLKTVARIVLDDQAGSLVEQLRHRRVANPATAVKVPIRVPAFADAPFVGRDDLIFFNGYGGFTRDGHEYVITLENGLETPAPWVNVLANKEFGTVVTERGSSYTWHGNAHESRLTPWSNDPVRDTTGEAFYLRDEDSGEFWSPSPGPAKGRTPYLVRHGFGYTVFEHAQSGISSEMWMFVDPHQAVKFIRIKIKNQTNQPRRLTATGYVEWVLGNVREKSLLHVITETDVETGALFARNPYDRENPDRIAFFDIKSDTRALSGDRKEFIGVNGDLASPAAMRAQKLSGKTGAGLDPCGAVQTKIDLAPNETKEITFFLGMGKNASQAREMVKHFREADAVKGSLRGVWEFWNRTLGALNFDTPDPAVNVMANGWLLYQTLSCRMWGRSGFYQSGGAYGFRDQLQDSMALVYSVPNECREHILRAAAHQFKEGDVMHWWHPPLGRGVRTKFSDDYLWLPFVVIHYVTRTGDSSVLDENVPFIEGRALRADEEAYYDLPIQSSESATVYEHCVRSIKYGLKFGKNGLPLMGCGDWNDGMNLVGIDGKGESVWLAFFLYDIMTRFSTIARSRDDHDFADHCTTEAAKLQKHVEENAWDGDWYRRAYFDNGEPLGSSENPECQIDSLPQSWSIISGMGDPERSKSAMQAVDSRLVRRDAGLVQLFDPPFDKSHLNPGYIKGYIPGVRENGGQYTHAAIWTGIAFAMMGDRSRAWEVFNLINPVRHGDSAESIATYLIEPYVAAADVYSVAPHTGRGGWSWYTGSAAWMYRFLIETLLGVTLEGDRLKLEPLLPKDWPQFKLHYRYHQTVYHITVTRAKSTEDHHGNPRLDGNELDSEWIPLVDDQQEHFVEVSVTMPTEK